MLNAFRQCVRLLLHFQSISRRCFLLWLVIISFTASFECSPHSTAMNVKAITTFAAPLSCRRLSSNIECLAFVSMCLETDILPSNVRAIVVHFPRSLACSLTKKKVHSVHKSRPQICITPASASQSQPAKRVTKTIDACALFVLHRTVGIGSQSKFVVIRKTKIVIVQIMRCNSNCICMIKVQAGSAVRLNIFNFLSNFFARHSRGIQQVFRFHT